MPTPSDAPQHGRIIAGWLLMCCVMIFGSASRGTPMISRLMGK